MESMTLFAGVALLTLAAPFELREPLLRLPRQSVSSLEAVLLVAFAAWGLTIVMSHRLPEWRTPLTLPWTALLLAMAVSSLASPVSRVNALHMTGRVAAAFGVFLLTVNGITTRARLRVVLTLAVGAGVVVSLLAILEYVGVPKVLAWLTMFRPNVATVGAQVRAGGPLQYPTIASMYLEVVFAFGLGLLLAELDRSRALRVAALWLALALIGEGIIVTFTRAGLITMAASVILVGGIRFSSRGVDAGVRIVAALAVVIVALFLSSRSTDSMWLRFTSEGQESWYRAAFDAPADLELRTGENAVVPVTVTNAGRLPWDSADDPPILLSYHWLPAAGDRFVTFGGARTPFTSRVDPQETTRVEARVQPPRQPGRYRLEWDVVQEGRLWFTTEPGASRQMSRVTIVGDPGDAPPIATLPPPKVTVRPGRFVLWRAAARMVAARPLLGVGPDNFRLAYGRYAGLASVDPRTHSNNMYLEMLAGGGLLVGAAFAWLLWRAGRSAAASLRVSATGAAAVGVVAATLAIALHATVDSFLSFAPTYVLFSLTLGCAAACARGAESPRANRV
jgi:O-antigen ligase/polysaccharide polymerase Wzy-like membrane protein